VNSRHSVAGRAGIAVWCVGAASGLWFTALFVEGDPGVFAFEWLGLTALLAGLGGAVLWGYSRGGVAGSTAIAAVILLAVWTTLAAVAR